jgi:ubiquinone/menaquinone biosynthesis C-methylase UbiE
VRFQMADASRAELPERAFDILFSRFGVMFFDDPAAAFAHMRRTLRPGGRVAFVCWRASWRRPDSPISLSRLSMRPSPSAKAKRATRRSTTR